MKKIKSVFCALDLKNNPSTVGAILLEIVWAVAIIVNVSRESVSSISYICVVISLMFFIGANDCNLRGYKKLRDKQDNFKSVLTCDLVRELEKREGVETTVLEPYEVRQLEFEGAAIILKITD